jgi:L-rhamnose mutarotase
MLAVACLFFCCTGLGCAQQPEKVKRYGSVIGIKKENIPEYRRLHANAWPGVLKTINECHIRNYSIYLAEVEPDKYYLFSYFEYTGDDLDKEVEEKMRNDPTTKKWWSHTDPLQVPVPTRKESEWWHSLEEVFHTD